MPITTTIHGQLTNIRAMIIPYFGYNRVPIRLVDHICFFTYSVVICLVEFLRHFFGDRDNMSYVDFGFICKCFSRYLGYLGASFQVILFSLE